jgi:hypothetical protein
VFVENAEGDVSEENDVLQFIIHHYLLKNDMNQKVPTFLSR